VHGVDSSVFQTFRDDLDTERTNTMRHENSVLHQILKHIPWGAFDGLVEQYQADKHVRALPTKSQLVALLYGQLSGAQGLREIVTGLRSHEARLYHMGVEPVRRSTFGDANAKRPVEVFSGLLGLLMKQAHRGLRCAMADTVYLIDSTGLKLDGRSEEWARFSADACGAKLHVIYDAGADVPVYAGVSAANVNDITPAKDMPIEPGATYVFDLGYYDYRWWAELDAAGCRIVTRFKKNTPLHLLEELRVKTGGPILSDRIGFLPQRQKYNRRNPFPNAVREVRVELETGKVLRILSNDLDAGAEEIAALYKRRWAIELFFRWIKQTLKIRRFIGTSENAVRIQIATALIAYLLLRLAHGAQKSVKTPLIFARLVRANLLHRRRIDRLLEPDIPAPNHPQLAIQWT
jgi:hypothetical protein